MNSDGLPLSNTYAGPAIGEMPLPSAFSHSSGNSVSSGLYEYQTSGCATGGSTRCPVLSAESLTGRSQLNGSPDVSVAKS